MVWLSLSRTLMVSLPEVHPVADPVTVTNSGPSIRVSSTAVRSKRAEVEPVGMVTDAGTVNSVGSLEVKVTTRLAVKVPGIDTLP